MKNRRMVLQALVSMILVVGLVLPASAVGASMGLHTLDEPSVDHLVIDSCSDASVMTLNAHQGQVTPMVAAGWGFTVGLRLDGSVVAVGSNSRGQCNVADWTGIIQVAAGHDHTVGLKFDGSAIAVGDNYWGQCNVAGWTDIIQVAAGGDHTVGLKSDGSVVAVGSNSYGQCNVENWTGIIQVAAGDSHTVGLKSDGSVVAVGENYWGQCNVAGWTGIIQVSAGFGHTVGVKSDGSVVAVGLCFQGQCNVAGWTDIIQVAAGYYHTVGLRSDGSVISVGLNSHGECNVAHWTGIIQVSAGYEHTVGLKSDGSVVAVGYRYWGQCNVADWTGTIGVAAGHDHTVGLKSDGSMVAVGSNSSGQCNVAGWTDIIQVAAGYYHTVGLKSDGSVVAVGYNGRGQCNVAGWTGIIQVSAAHAHTVGLKSDGSVVAVGYDYFGQCNVAGWTDIIQVSAGYYHTVGLKSDGSVVAMGANSYGQCNVENWTGIIQVAAGGSHTVGLKSEGPVVAAGLDVELAKWNLGETAQPPTEIWDWYDLDAIRHDLSGSYVLMRDLDSTTAGYDELAGPYANDEKGWRPIGFVWEEEGEYWWSDWFAGSFDGQGYEIREVFTSYPDEWYVGLFSGIDEKGIIQNIGVVDSTAIGDRYAGILVGVNLGGVVTDSYSAGVVTAYQYAGGLAGGNWEGTVSNCHSIASVYSIDDYAGGLLAENYKGAVSDSYSIGEVNCGDDYGGGLVGSNYRGAIASCYSTAAVAGGDWAIGGLVGDNYHGTVADSHSTGSVTADQYAGGLVGVNYYGAVANSYSTSHVVAGEYVGGLVGNNMGTVENSHSTGNVVGGGFGSGGLIGVNLHQGAVSNSYSTGLVTGDIYTGGLVGFNDATVSSSFWDVETSGIDVSDGGTGKTTAEMMSITTFTDTNTEGLGEPWDMVAVVNTDQRNLDHIWNIVNGITYPFLSWQQPAGVPDNHPPIASVLSLGGQPKIMYPNIQYTVAAAYHDPDGMEDLEYCYLRLNHPTKPLTLMWNRATDEYSAWAGEEGANYVTVTGWTVPMPDTGYDLNWQFTLNDSWPEVEDAIDFGVFAMDNQGAVSGWDYDETKASFRSTEADQDLIDALTFFADSSISHINSLGDTITGTDGFVELADYLGLSVSKKAAEAYLGLGGTLANALFSAVFDVVIVDLPIVERMLLLIMYSENRADDIPGDIAQQIAEADLSIRAELESALDRVQYVDPELVEVYLRDLELRRDAHSYLYGISYRERDGLRGAANAIKTREPFDMAMRTIWSIGKTLVAVFYPPAWPLLLLDTVRSTMALVEEMNEAGVLWASSISAGSTAQTSIWEVWSNTTSGLRMVAEGEQPRIPEGELVWVSDHLIDHDAAIRGLIRIQPPVRLGEEAYSLVQIRNTGQDDAMYKLVVQFYPEYWSAAHTISVETAVGSDDSSGLRRLDYTELELVYAETPDGQQVTLRTYRGTPPQSGNLIPYCLFARTETGFYGVDSPWLGRLYSPTSEPGFSASAPFPMAFARLGSPGELRAHDSAGRVSGMVDGELRQEIPNAVAFDDGMIIVIDPTDIVYRVEGTATGTYELELIFVEDGESDSFFGTGIPTIAGAFHQYSIDWDALARGEDGVTVSVDPDGDGEFDRTFTTGSELTGDQFVLHTETFIDFDPDVLNLRARGGVVTAYIELPEGFDVNEIDVSSIRLNDTVPPLSWPTAIGDYNNNGIPDLMVKFDIRAVQKVVGVGESVEITITGEVDGIPFMGVDTIRVIG